MNSLMIDRVLHSLHPAQENVYFDQILDESSPKYNIGGYQRWDQPVCHATLELAWRVVVSHCDALRLKIIDSDDGIPKQIILPVEQVDTNVDYRDFSVGGDSNQDSLNWIKEQFEVPFEINNGALFKLSLIKVSDDIYYVSPRLHHLVADGLSVDLLMCCIHEAYTGIVDEASDTILEKIPSYTESVNHYHSYVGTKRYEKDKHYWQQFLREREISRLPVRYPGTRGTGACEFSIGSHLYHKLQLFCNTHNTSLMNVISSIMTIYFSRMFNLDEIIFATPYHGRRGRKDELSVGMHSNIFLVANDIEAESSFAELLIKCARRFKSSLRRAMFPQSHINRLTGDAPINPHIHINYIPFNRSEIDFHEVESTSSIPVFDLRVIDFLALDKLTLRVNYQEGYFNEEDISRFWLHYKSLLESCIDEPYRPLSSVSFVTDEERYTLLHRWNQTDAPYPQDKTLPQLFEAQVAKTPDNIALVFEEKTLTYRELNAKANQLAYTIREQHQVLHGEPLQPDTLIALYLDRSLEMLISILAVLKAGGAYVPISPEYPKERSQFILEDTQAALLLTQSQHIAQLDELTHELSQQPPALIATDTPETTEGYETTNFESVSGPDDLAYVIYTSGTTGKPKGVMVSHTNIVNNVDSQIKFYEYGDDEVTLFYRTYCFDGSIEEYLTPLLCGSKVIIMKGGDIFDVDLFKHLIIHENVSKINASPSFLLGLLDNMQDIYDISSLRLIIAEGERLPEDLAIKITSIGYELVNSYGPTEATDDTLRFIFTPGIPTKKSIIGRPIHNTQAFVLDNSLLLMPIGAPGELHIGGAGVARGYLNRPDLTAERFIDNPFATASDIEKGYTRLYKTGDLVRWLPDGNLEYLGRNDFQVKIRGYRIELGEIESALVALEGIKQAVVIDRERAGSKYLAAYIVSDEVINPDALVLSLSQVLPEFMVPSALVQIDDVPLTINGKLDRCALPEPDLMDADNYVAPRNEQEAQLCSIWQEVLGLDSVGIYDNFFRIGGDSIVSIQLVSRLRKAGLSLQVKDIFDAPTIAQLAECVSVATEVVIDAEQGVLTGTFDLLPIQQWFFDKALIELNHYNQAFVQRIPDDISTDAVELMLDKLSAHHCMLRVHYAQADLGWQQIYGEQSRMAPLVTLDVAGMPEAALSEKLTTYQASLDIETGPAWQVVHLIDCEDDYARLVFIAHHLIIDAVSWRILADDMQSLLTGQTLPAKTSSYRQWVNTVAQYAVQHEAQVPYWRQVGEGAMCYPHPQAPSSHTLEWDASLTTRLLREAPKGYHTEINDLLLSALAMALAETFDCDRTPITLEGHGRESIAQAIDTSRTIGWFTTTYPVALERMQNPESTLIQTKEMLRGVPDKGIGFGALTQAGQLNQPLPPVSFNYLGQFDGQNESGLWQLTGENSGDCVSQANQDALLLNINGAVQHGRLSFHIGSQLSESSTALFLSAFESAVKHITDLACAKAVQGGLQTPSDYAVSDLSLARLQSIQSRHANIEAIYPANSLQQGFIVHDLAHPEDDAYRVQLLFDYHQPLNVELYQRAWQAASERYPALRMAFDVEGEPLQIITRGNALTAAHFIVIDLSHLDEAARETRLVEIQQTDRQSGFDLSCPGLLRLHLVKQADNHYTVIKTEHHTVSDGWSGPVLWQFVHETYLQLCDGRSPAVLPETTYLSAQEYSVKHQAVSQQYWSEQKAQWEGATDIQYLLSHPQRLHEKRVVNELAEVSLALAGVDLNALKQQCQVQGITLNVAVQFAWHKLLQIYSGSDQTIVGTTVSGRDIPVEGIEQSVGLYINTLPLCVHWDKTIRCSDVLQRIHQQIAALNSHSHVSLAGLQSNGERLFQSLLVFENYPTPTDDNNHEVTFRESVEKTDYPLSLVAYESQGCLSVKLQYDAALLTDTQATRLISQMEQVLKVISHTPEQRHDAIDLLCDDERQTLLHTWNETDAPYPQDKTLSQLFETQVEKTPDNIALVFEEETLTYRELNHRANQLARLIRERFQQQQGHALTPDTLVALYLDRSLEMVVSILGVLKSGGAYVPVSPEYPKERTQFILEDTQVALLLTQSQHIAQLDEWTHELSQQPPALIATDMPEMTEGHETANLESVSGPGDLAYVIYTSGTTGKPKGVMLEHKNAHNTLHGMKKTYHFSSQQNKTTCFSNYTFDVSVSEIFNSLCYGGELHLFNDLLRREPGLLMEYVEQNEINFLFVPPAILSMLPHKKISTLKVIVFAGDRCEASSSQYWAKNYSLYNYYGPTETAIYASGKQAELRNLNEIGCPIPNVKLYVLNSTLNLPSIGAPGELYIGGAGLARGYLNRPDLTAERFIDNPFATASDIEKGYTRLYKTGDLVRWLPDGNLEYLGRNDFQVKIRGYRVELGEIESALAALEGIKQAVVIDRERAGSKYLAAYVVSDEVINPDALILSLSQVLPEYMVPSAFVQIDEVPLTINGKLDRRALPEPDLMDADNYVAPRNEQEAQLCAVWQDVLGLESVGIYDNFFRIGGDSITAIRLTAASRKAMGVDIPLAQLFECKTIARLASKLVNEKLTVIPSCQKTQYPLSFAQERLWFIERLEQGSSAYHMPNLVKLNSDAQWAVLQEALSYLVKRHSVLSSTYQTDEQELEYQVLLDEPLTVESLRVPAGSDWLTLVRNEVSRPFNLSDEIPLRVRHYEVGTEQYVLLLWHHIAFDGWSIDIFLRELTLSYSALVQQKAIVLPELEISYGDYAQWQRDYLQGPRLASELQYWTETLSGYETLALTTDHPRPLAVDYRGRDHDFTLDAQLSEQLRELARNQETTLYTVLLSAFYVTLSALSGQDDILVGTPSENRHHPQTQDLVGFFVNSLVLRAWINSDVSVQEMIHQVHRVIMGAKEHQELPFEKLVDALDVERDLARHPLFQVMFSLQRFGESMPEGLPFTPVNVTETSADYSVAKFDISLFLNDQSDEIAGQFNYAVSLFEPESIERMSTIYLRILRAFVDNAQQTIGQIDVLSQSERHTLLHTWNETDAPYPQDKTLAQLFEAQVEKTPNNIALVFEEETLTYSELNHRANQLARLIRERFKQHQGHALTPDTLIALYLDRSLEMVVSILAVLKSGAAYVPISPEYPKERTQFLLKDTQTALLLTQTRHLTQLDTWTHELSQQPPALIATDIHETTKCYETANLESVSGPDDLAYVIYTSGTTGKPKGVAIEHRASVIRNLDMAKRGNTRINTYLFKTNYVFDVSVSDLFTHLLVSAKVVISNACFDLQEIIKLTQTHQINACHFVPSQYSALHSTLPVKGCWSALYFSGENLTREQLDHIDFDCTRTLNYYGPTETGEATYFAPQSNHDHDVIGRPLAGVSLYVMQGSHLAPIGAPGELYIGGAGLARGYLNRPDLTAERFINNPFATASDIEKGYTRLYKTGDLVRWLPDGNLEYLGRNDFQVKIRGYRIELGEIESALLALEGIKQTVVIDRERSGSKYLAAYIVSDEIINPDALTLSLSQVLPEYMVPGAFVQIDDVPLTINGKLDRRALPEPGLPDCDNYVAPRNEMEVQLCAIWQDILGMESVGVRNNFFHLGGNSISAIKLNSQITNRLGRDCSVRDIFAHPTIASLADILTMGEGTSKYQPFMLKEHHSEDQENYQTFPINNVLQAYLVGRNASQTLGGVGTHGYVELRLSNVDIKRLERSINVLIRRHDVLRSVFEGGQQRFLPSVPEYRVMDYGMLDDAALEQVRGAMSHKVYDPSVYPLFDISSSQYGGIQLLHFSMDALLMDGTSYSIFFHELGLLYVDPETSLPPLHVNYRDYALQYQEIRSSELYESDQAWWLSRLDEFNLSAQLPLCCDPSEISTPKFNRISKTLSPNLWSQLKQKSMRANISPTSLVLYAYGLVLSRWTGHSDVCINLTLFNRLPLHAQINDILGDFTVLELFAWQRGAGSLISRMQATHEQLWQDIEHNLFDGVDVQRLLRRKHQLSPGQIIAPYVLTAVLGEDHGESDLLPLGFEGVEYSITQTSQVYLDHKAYESAGGLVAEWDYPEQLFEHSMLEQMHTDYCHILEQLAVLEWAETEPANVLPELESDSLVYRLNQTEAAYPEQHLLSGFERQVKLQPDAVAVIDAHGETSYEALNRQRCHVAAALAGLSPGALVAVLSEKGGVQLAGCLGVLSVRGAYLPLHVDWPEGRIVDVLGEGDVETLLLSASQYQRLKNSPWLAAYRVEILDELVSRDGDASFTCLSPEVSDLAYVIFTSGSTGKPKGVMVSHAQAMNTIEAVNRRFELGPKDRVLALSELSFDLSVWDMFGLLSAGGGLVYPQQSRTKDPEHWIELVEQHQVTVWNTVPQLTQLLTEEVKGCEKKLSTLRLILMSGDWIPLTLPTQISRCCDAIQVSLGGATEGSIWSIWYEIGAIDPHWTSIPYGTAMPNQQMWVLNEWGEPCPLGVSGEICIGGAGVVLGYTDAQKSAAQFRMHPKFGRLYHTGDLGAWQTKGHIEFLGRLDFQVKIRGFRVELGEIESALSELAQVMQAVVIDRERQGDKYLAAYIIAVNNECVDVDMLRDELAMRLPEYMLPSTFSLIDSVPLTINGKLDRRALPEPEFVSKDNYVAPHNDLEKNLCTIWQDILGLESVGVQDDFFHLGGNSISAIKLNSQITNQLGCDCSVRDIFAHPTVASLADILTMGEGTSRYQPFMLKEHHSEDQENYQAFPINNVLQAYLVGRNASQTLGGVGTHGYVELRLSNVDIKRLERSINVLIRRHDVLRSVFEGGQQRFLPSVPEYRVMDYGMLDDAALEQVRGAMSHKVYDPSVYPLFDISISQYGDIQLLHFSMDALLMDGTSYSTFYHELGLLYVDPETSLPPLHVNYRDYALQYQEIRSSELYKSDQAWWLSRLDDFNLSAQLPYCCDPSEISTPTFNRISKTLSPNLWSQLKQKSMRANISPTSLVLYAYGLVLSRWTGHRDVCINLTLFNRLPLHAQINDILGDFTVLELFAWQRGDGSLISRMQATHEQLWQDIEHNLFDGVDVQRALRRKHQLPPGQILVPYVLTAVLGEDNREGDLSALGFEGVEYSITQTSQVYLDHKAYESAGGLVAEWDYPDQLFEHSVLEQMHTDYCHILEQLAVLEWAETEPANVLPELESDSLVYRLNQTEAAYPEQHLLSGFERQVKLQPDAVAVIDAHGETSYEALNRQRCHVAAALAGLSPGALVAVLSEKGGVQLAGCLGVLSVRGAYLPLHVDWPEGRIVDVLGEGDVETLLLSASQYQRLKNSSWLAAYRVEILDELVSRDGDASFTCLSPEVSDLAYVIFTSGSTGKPKGVMVSHAQAMNTIEAVNRRFELGPKDRVLALSELSFDLSVWDMFGLLSAGGGLVYPQQSRTKDPEHWVELVEQHQVTVWNTVPQLTQLLTEEVKGCEKKLSTLRLVLMSGDWIPLTLPAQISRCCDAIQVSLGGATEGSIWSIWYEIGAIDPHWTIIPYGTAMPNQQMWVLNEWGEPCPLGVSGEICIGGAGVVLGYTDAQKSAAQFRMHPKFGRLYHTGDLGAWQTKGHIEFLGRLDSQAKVNGYRVEPDELTARLCQLSGIEKAVSLVLKEPGGQPALVSWLQLEHASEESLDKSAFRQDQRGLRTDLTVGEPLNLCLDESAFRLRKSYRQLQSLSSAQELQIKQLQQLVQSESSIEESSPLEQLLQSLEMLSALQLPDKTLPKYRYPSAGSSYAIRTYVILPEGVLPGHIAGRYYYHPVQQTLCFEESVEATEVELEWVAEQAAIEPMYGEQSTRYLALELGHILSLLPGLGWGEIAAGLTSNWSGATPRLLRLPLQRAHHVSSRPEVCWHYYTREEGRWIDARGQSVSSIDDLPVSFRASAQGQMLQSAPMLLVMETQETLPAWVYAGLQAGRLDELLPSQQLGSCWLGTLPPGISGSYGCVLGSVSEADQLSSEDPGVNRPLTSVIRELLAEQLPDYLLPARCEVLCDLPLTSNGKIDRKGLPEPLWQTQQSYTAPRSDEEQELCRIWQEVLVLEQVGIDDNFFRIGGDSMTAIRAVSAIRQAGYETRVQQIYQYPSVRQLASVLSERVHTAEQFAPFSLVSESIREAIGRDNERQISNIYPASLIQSGMLIESARRDGVYHERLQRDFVGTVDRLKLKSVWQSLIQRHALLRSRFELSDAGYLIVEQVEEEVDGHLLLGSPDSGELALKRFELFETGLFRVYCDEQRETWQLTILFHHVIADGWSISQLMREFELSYFAQEPMLQSPPSYEYFVQAEQKVLRDVKQQIYWKNYLSNVEPADMGYVPQVEATEERVALTIPLSDWQANECLQVAHQLELPMDSLFLAMFSHVLSLFYASERFTLGLVVNNRPEVTGSEQMVGVFLNTIPLKIETADIRQRSAQEWYQTLHQQRASLRDFQRYPYAQIKADTHPERDWYECTFNYTHFKQSESGYGLEGQGTLVEATEKFPLSFEVNRQNDGFVLSLSARSDFADTRRLQQLQDYLLASLPVQQDLNQPMPTLLTSEQLLYRQWNQTDAPYPQDKTIQQLFEDQVEKTPENIALVFEDKRLTYRELNARANQLAHAIREQHQMLHGEALQPDTLIALYLDRSLEMVISILAVLKAGGAYVPISPEYPQERTCFMLEDTRAPILLTQQPYLEKLEAWVSDLDSTLTLISTDVPAVIESQSKENPVPYSGPDNLAYVIYTSGTTGRPKGVMIQHFSLNNRIDWMQCKYPITTADIVLQKTPYTFDVSVWEFVWPLVVGSKLVVSKPEGHKDSGYLTDLIQSEEITVLHFVPSMFGAMLQDPSWSDCMTVRQVFCSGEALPVELVKKHYAMSKAELDNLYGPTEASIDVSFWSCKNEIEHNSVPIGRPINNTQLYVLDNHQELVPMSAPGELYIGGAGVALGYLNRPELTAERFIDNPFATEKNKAKGYTRLYKTGDLVRWLPDGNLEYLGRNDFQVKIRGFRIELGEIESALSGLPQVKQAVVIDREREGEKYLAAYIVAGLNEAIDTEVLVKQLSASLPDYMVPATFTLIDSIPLTLNGKLDRRALPEPEFVSGDNYVAPRNEIEAQLCDIWKQVLGLEQVGIEDNFFSIGGDSIRIIKVVGEVSNLYSKRLPVEAAMKYGTVKSLADYIEREELNKIKEAPKNKVVI